MFTQEKTNSVSYFFKWFLHLFKFKYWLYVALIILVSGTYDFFFVQNHIFALNNETTIANQLINADDHVSSFKSSDLNALGHNKQTICNYMFRIPKYGKWQDDEYLMVKSPSRNIQTIRTIGYFKLSCALPNYERPINRIFHTQYIKKRIEPDEANMDSSEIQEAQDNGNIDADDNYLIMGTKKHYRSYTFSNIYPVKKDFTYQDTISYVKKLCKQNLNMIQHVESVKLSNYKYYVNFTVNPKKQDFKVSGIYNTKTKQVEMAQFGSETYVSHYLFDNTKFPTYTLYVNNQNLSNRYVNNLYKHFCNQTQTD